MSSDSSNAMVVWKTMELTLVEVKRAIAETTDPVKLKSLRAKAEGVRKFAQNAALGLELQNRAAEIKLCAERRAGELLAELKLRGGDRKTNNQEDRLTLADLEISQNQSTRWQKTASIPEEIFRQYVQQIIDEQKELTAKGLLRLVRRHANGDGSSKKDKDLVDVDHVEVEPTSDLSSCIEEICCHCDLLEDLLQPIYDGHEQDLHRSEREHIGRLVGEIGRLLALAAQLARTVTD